MSDNGSSLNLKRAKSIDDLYKKVKDQKLVLTVDAPLADALNVRLSQPRIGPFTTTPRRLAMSKIPNTKKFSDKREIFIRITDQTDLNWKRASYLFENIVNCWKETGNPKKILRHEWFDHEDTKEIINILTTTINPYSAIEEYTAPNDIAIIAPHQFTELDKKILPNHYEKIKPFKEDKTTLPPFNIFNSTSEIIQTILNNIREPKDVAVVMKKDSDYRYLVESLFRSNDIPYMVSRDITEHESVRKFLNIIRYSFFNRGIKLKDLRSFTNVHPKKEEYLLQAMENDNVNKLIQKVPEMTFKELLNHDFFDTGLEDLEEQLKDIELLKKQITLQRFNALTYYLETFDIQIKTAGQGVLIASPSSSTYIDRPIVFYLGLDSSWTPEPPSTPWVDKKKYDKRKKKDFKILLQNGQKRYFLVQDRKMNRTITPSFYFNEFTEQDMESFTDLKHEFKKEEIPRGHSSPFKKQNIQTKKEEKKMMSQSTLNTFAYCPKDHFFSELIDSSDKVYFRRGTAFHDLAEFLINHPVMKENEDKIIQRMTEEMSPFVEEHELPVIKTRFRVGFENLVRFLEDQKVELTNPEGYEKKYTDNIFSDLFDEPITSKFTEVSFYNNSIGAKGKVDLVLDHNYLVDHKTGSKKSLSKLMKKSDIHHIKEKPDFQAKMYIAHHRHHNPNTPINFSFFYMLNNERDMVSGDGDYTDNIVNIEYYPREFNDMVHEEEIYDWLIEGVASSNDRRKTLEKLGYGNYEKFFEGEEIPDIDKDDIVESELKQRFVAYCKGKVGDNKYVEKGCKSALRKLLWFRNNRYFKSDIDEFEEFLQDEIEKYNEYKETSFPTNNANLDEIENKDLVIL